MKHFYFLLLLAISTITASAQVLINAGSDQHWCRDFHADSIKLGGFPTASGGTAPYTFEWSVDPMKLSPASSLTFYASNFLGDTSIANPWLLGLWNDSLTVYLKVSDSQNIIGWDTITITSTTFATHLGNYTFHINVGDSVQLMEPNVTSSSNPIWDSVLWRPNTGVIDSNAIRPWVKPEKDVVYYAVVWDKHGCFIEGAPFQYVFVHNLSNAELETGQGFQLYPTYVHKDQTISIQKPVDITSYTCTITDFRGRSVKEITSKQEVQNVFISDLAQGVYLYTIHSQEKPMKKGKLVIH